jgi:hypothetical protein
MNACNAFFASASILGACCIAKDPKQACAGGLSLNLIRKGES